LSGAVAEHKHYFDWTTLKSLQYPDCGNRMGWRLPTIQELAVWWTLGALSWPTLPAGHPFSKRAAGRLLSATSNASNTGLAWVVDFFFGVVGNGVMSGNRD